MTGGFSTIEEAEVALQDGVAMVGFGRKFLRNDRFLVDQTESKCFRCNACIGKIFKGDVAECPQHAKELKAKAE